jgi:DNA repair ATPase RecN
MTPIGRIVRPVLALTLVLAQAIAAVAQDQPPSPDRGGRGGQVVRPAELAAMLDAYTLMQAQNALQLSDTQYGPFVTRLKRLQENRRRNTQIRNRLLQELRTLTAPNATPDENALKEKMRALREHNLQAAATLQRDSEALDEVLDVRQQVRFRLLEERVERQKLDLLMLSRRRVTPAPGEGRNPR